jgi:putative transposase
MITYKYRLYRNKKNQRLHQTIDVAGLIWNHCVALQRRYYALTGKYISRYALQKHIAKLRNRPKYSHWKRVGSQAAQEIVERLDKAYQRFFKYKAGKTTQKAGRPSFKKVKKYSSFTLKQAGWKLLDRNRIWIQGTVYKYSKSREIEGQIKTVTVKRDELGNLWLCFAVEHGDYPKPVTSSHIVGLDFGLKTFLTPSEGTPVESPQFFKESLADIRRCSRALSRKQKGSHNRRKAIRELARTHARIQNKRNDWFFKLAHRLVDQFDVLVLEDLNLRAMQRMWGRKVSDLGFAHFVDILKHVAAKRGRTVYLVDRFFPSSKTCSACGAINHSLELSERCWVCAVCGVTHDRDLNAALNLAREGASSLGLGDVRPAQQASDRCGRLSV